MVGAGCYCVMKKVTLIDIAKACNVSKGAVSRALADKYNIGEEASYKIKQTAIELGYDFSKLKINKTVNKKVLILCPSRLFFRENFWQTIVKSAADRLSKSSIHTDFFIFDENNITESLSNFKKVGYKGFIVIHYNVKELMDEIAKQCLPTVVIDPVYSNSDTTNVRFSNFDSSHKATKLLLKNHNRISFYGIANHASSFDERYDGFMKAISEEKDIANKNLLFEDKNNDYSDNEKLKKLIQEFKPTALVCANDIIALNAYKVIKALGLKIPEDISVIGFDNIQESAKVNPRLTTVNIPLVEIGDEAASYLLNVIQNRHVICSEIVIRCDLVIRESIK